MSDIDDFIFAIWIIVGSLVFVFVFLYRKLQEKKSEVISTTSAFITALHDYNRSRSQDNLLKLKHHIDLLPKEVLEKVRGPLFDLELFPEEKRVVEEEEH